MDRRTLLRGIAVGGSLVGLGALSACATGSSGPDASASASATGTPLGDGDVVPLALFSSETFNGEALFALGGASSHTAEVGEILRIARNINKVTGNPGDPATAAFDAYYDGFAQYGDQLASLASKSGTAHPVTTRDRNMRASTCAAQSLFFVLGTSNGSREESIFQTTQGRWLQAIKTWTPSVTRTTVPSRFGPLPVYFFPAPGSGRKPTVIISSGSDGQNVEQMQFGVTAGLARGYNVVLFEGPGQMSLLFEKNIPFTPNWDQVVGPVYAWTRRNPSVGKVGLIGISFGGMLCARAAAMVSGLDAVVLEPAAYDMSELWGDQKSLDIVRETSQAPAQEQEQAAKELNEGFAQAWPSMSRTQQFVIYKRGEIFSPRLQADARAGRAPSNYYGMLKSMIRFNFESDYEKITIPTMVTSNQGDQFFGKQSVRAFGMLEKVPAAQKILVDFTAEEGASLHDQPVGPQPAQEVIFDWLDEYLR